jgi:molecular chaperone DnaK
MSHAAIGIDLGTTFSVLAVINPSGRPEIIPNREGERLTASAVFFQDEGSVLVGDNARAAALGDPNRVVTEVKRYMGSPDHRFERGGRSYTPVDISAIILKRIRDDGERVLGPLKHVVITVPAYFDEIRRKATMDAARTAGFDVLRIINEPTAAALAYAADGRVRGKVLVYDFGGGTFDVSVVEIASPTDVRVLASEGDHQLGGKDLDRALAKHLSALFRQQHGIALEGDPRGELATLEEAERAKKRLSSLTTVSGISLIHQGKSMTATVERKKYEALVDEYIVRTAMLVDDALKAAGLTASGIDTVLLVGGSSRTPAVQAMLQRKFGKAPQMGINPDEAVALGAAIQAGVLMQQSGLIALPGAAGEALRRTNIQDVSPHSYGTIAIGDAYGRAALRNSIIIPKNTPLPCSKSEKFYTVVEGQTSISCKVTQGEDEDPEFVKVVYEADLALPPNRPANREVRVTFAYDVNGRMACEFLDVESTRTSKVSLDVATENSSTAEGSDFDDLDLDKLVIE